VVLPETAITGYMSSDIRKTWQVDDRSVTDGLSGVDPTDAAETVPGISTEMFGELADKLDIYITVPLLEVDRKTGRYYNTVCLMGPDGNMLLHYRKRDPWQWAERGWATPGDRGNPVVDTPFGRLGCLICFDIHDQAAIMSELKVDHLLYSIAWVDDADSDWFDERLPAIAKQYDMNIIGANWTVSRSEKDPDWHGYGQSLVIARNGEVLARTRRDHGADIVWAELPVPGDANQ
ncbi:MAG: carbon-nitrogen hydrolase family protein, partial [Firmicutes bacterium]|nr:carbon-nitrogen hydrolase family protein [Bacillota bacterium]